MVETRVKDIEPRTIQDSDILLKDNIDKTTTSTALELYTYIRDKIFDEILGETISSVGLMVYGFPQDTSNMLRLNTTNNYDKSDYPELVDILDTYFGVNGVILPSGNNWYAGDTFATFKLPNLEGDGYMLRPQGINLGYQLGSFIDDATRKITGKTNQFRSKAGTDFTGFEGVIDYEAVDAPQASLKLDTTNFNTYRLTIDSSRQVPTASENRVKTFQTPIWIIAKPTISLNITELV